MPREKPRETARAGIVPAAASPHRAPIPTRRRPRSEPRRWRQRNVPRRWRYKLAPNPLDQRPKGVPGIWGRGRRLLWSWWPWAIVAVWTAAIHEWGWAAGTGAMAFVSYLIAPRERPPRYGLDHQFGVETEEFLSSMVGATGVPFVEGNKATIYNNGDEFYPAMLADIERAEDSVTIEAYIYWAGNVGVMFAKALAARAQAGIKVKILLDAVGSATIGEEILRILESGKCQLAWYNPIHWYTIGRFNNRTHRKSLIVDGRVGYTGGAGIADHWLGCAQDPDHWRDMQIRLEGPAVIPLQNGFAQNWLKTTGELVSGPLFYPPPERSGPVPIQTLLSSPETGSSSVRTSYYLSIVCARRSIYIANPYFVPDEVAAETLIDARRRGVDVKVMVSGIRNDNWLARQNSVRLSGQLLRAGIEIYEYNRTMLHHKTMVVDRRWATIGTTNFDNRSFAHNEENNICFYDRSLVEKLHAAFVDDLKLCEKLDYEKWKRRGVLTHIQEFIAGFLEDQV
jgi:cardiolipin synthase